jgi:ATP-dependent Clp protease ATP-binding subunit ClpC
MTELVPMTDRATRVIELARDFARTSAHSTVETEHILFALAAEGDGLAANALKWLGVECDAIRDCVERLGNVQAPDITVNTINELRMRASEECALLGHNYVGTEHLLLALTRISRGRCSAVLATLKLDPELIRKEVYSILGHDI